MYYIGYLDTIDVSYDFFISVDKVLIASRVTSIIGL